MIDRKLMRELRGFLARSAHPLIVILGPTASGKTAFSIDLARILKKEGIGAEIINADSRQLYRHLDIGTAKISKKEMHGIPHHLLNVLDPDEEVTAAWYKEEAAGTIGEILQRGHLPMLVGGSMLYISAVMDGLRFAPAGDPKVRTELERSFANDHGKTLSACLWKLDPEAAAAINPKNPRHVVRALEIVLSTGKRVSDAKKKGTVPFDLFVIGMQWPREKLKKRIHERTHVLFEEGWVAEVRGLMKKGYRPDAPAMESHGYREIMEALRSGAAINEEKLCEAITKKSCAYAKRQMTWWKHDRRIHWIRPEPARPKG
ncbi:MAG: tRNA (adenosine(37)-N6)-dimethylallyltransferase MiaA [Candidatus Peregrinibacteria bacterium]